MEHLTKQQLVLVALLVSFVSSIATGIVTVSLLDQAPPAVTQTINRVIEKTVERVVPAQNGAAIATKETVIVSEDDAVTKAIDVSTKTIVRVKMMDRDGGTSFAGFGVITSTDGLIVARVSYDGSFRYHAFLSGGNEIGLSYIRSDDENGLVLFKAENGSGADLRTFTPAILGDSSALKLGQKVIAIGGEENNSVTTAIISSVSEMPDTTAPPAAPRPKELNRIRASVYTQSFLSRSVLINLSGEVVGLKIGSEAEDGYVPSNFIKILTAVE